MREVMILCYDIGSDRVRRRVDMLLSQYGERIQYSVFELVVSATEWPVLRGELQSLIDENQDSINFYPLCRWCRDNILLQGKADLPGREGFTCIC